MKTVAGAFKRQPTFPSGGLREEGRKQKNDPLWNFKIKFFFTTLPRSYLVMGACQKHSVLRVPRCVKRLLHAKHFGALVAPEKTWSTRRWTWVSVPGSKDVEKGCRGPRSSGAGDTREGLHGSTALTFRDRKVGQRNTGMTARTAGRLRSGARVSDTRGFHS